VIWRKNICEPTVRIRAECATSSRLAQRVISTNADFLRLSPKGSTDPGDKPEQHLHDQARHSRLTTNPLLDAGLSRAQCPSRLPSLTILESPTFGTVGSRARWATRPFLGANGGLEAIKSLAPSFGRKISHVVAKRGKADWSRFQGVGCKCATLTMVKRVGRWIAPINALCVPGAIG